MKRRLVVAALAVLPGLFVACTQAETDPSPPNIVVLFAGRSRLWRPVQLRPSDDPHTPPRRARRRGAALDELLLARRRSARRVEARYSPDGWAFAAASTADASASSFPTIPTGLPASELTLAELLRGPRLPHRDGGQVAPSERLRTPFRRGTASTRGSGFPTRPDIDLLIKLLRLHPLTRRSLRTQNQGLSELPDCRAFGILVSTTCFFAQRSC